MNDITQNAAMIDAMRRAFDAKDTDGLQRLAQELLSKAEAYIGSHYIRCHACGELIRPDEAYRRSESEPFICEACLDTSYLIPQDCQHPCSLLWEGVNLIDNIADQLPSGGDETELIPAYIDQCAAALQGLSKLADPQEEEAQETKAGENK